MVSIGSNMIKNKKKRDSRICWAQMSGKNSKVLRSTWNLYVWLKLVIDRAPVGLGLLV